MSLSTTNFHEILLSGLINVSAVYFILPSTTLCVGNNLVDIRVETSENAVPRKSCGIFSSWESLPHICNSRFPTTCILTRRNFIHHYCRETFLLKRCLLTLHEIILNSLYKETLSIYITSKLKWLGLNKQKRFCPIFQCIYYVYFQKQKKG